MKIITGCSTSPLRAYCSNTVRHSAALRWTWPWAVTFIVSSFPKTKRPTAVGHLFYPSPLPWHRTPRSDRLQKTKVKRCLKGCSGQLRPDEITRVFRRTGSPVEVILENIPAEVCQVCGRAFFSKEIARGIDRILFPFHGKHKKIPDLSPARVIIDFDEAQRKKAT